MFSKLFKLAAFGFLFSTTLFFFSSSRSALHKMHFFSQLVHSVTADLHLIRFWKEVKGPSKGSKLTS